MKKLTKTEAELKKSVTYKKRVFFHTFQRTSSDFYYQKKVSRPTKASKKDHLFYNAVSLKKRYSFYQSQVTRHRKRYPPATLPETFLTLQIFQQTSRWC